MLILSTLIGKMTFLVSHALGRKGSALPGLVVEKFDKTYLSRSLSQLSGGFVVVSGTNGKTTTTKIIVELLRANGLQVVTNPTGSNFVRGIIGALVKASTLTGHLPYDIAIFEQDEAHAVQLVKRVHPNGVVLLNVMRDQMDRFGEIDTTAKLLGQVAEQARDWVVLNANDHRISKLGARAAAIKKSWFGHSPELIERFGDDDQHYKGHAGAHFEATIPDVLLTGINDHTISLEVNKKSYVSKVQLTGTHNALNIVAAITTVRAIMPDVSVEQLLESLTAIEPAFGRGELIRLKSGSQLRLQLVKNPAGFMHALRQLDDNQYSSIGIAINDNDPDGRDVSWLWDVDFSSLKKLTIPIVCGGIRAYDMAVRLKYDEVKVKTIKQSIKPFIDVLISQVNNPELIVFCTYTAMLEIRKQLKHVATNMEEGL